MDCKNLEGLLWEFCEGSLAGDSARSVEEHLSGCPRCRRARSQIEATLGAMRAIGEGVGEIQPSRDFDARLRQRIDAWDGGRRAFWLTVWAGFLARNRRLLVTSAMAFAVALFGGMYVLKSMVGSGDMAAKQVGSGGQVATSYEGVGLTPAGSGAVPESEVPRDYVLREFPYSAPVLTVSGKDAADTVYVRFPTRDLTPPRGVAGDNYIYQPVVTPVNESEPIF